MSFRTWLLLGICLLHVMPAAASTESQAKVLRAYGPGGPHHVLQECAERFRQTHGVDVQIIKALPHDLESRIPVDGDLYFGGAEYMLEEFDRLNPGVLDVSTTAHLYPRRIGIIVRKGNPLGIMGVEDLRRPGVDILDVKLENMRHFHLTSESGLGNIRHHEYTGRQGVGAWLDSPEIDAWITYKSWHLTLTEHADFIEIPGDRALRYTPMALTPRTPYPQEAMNFIRFLKSDEARRIFEEHGWD